jgi:hypothetical protein
MKSSVVFRGVNVYLELGCLGNECITLQSICYFHYQSAAAIFIKFHYLDGLCYSVLHHSVNLFQSMGVVVLRKCVIHCKTLVSKLQIS